jgi:hypothetical protein
VADDPSLSSTGFFVVQVSLCGRNHPRKKQIAIAEAAPADADLIATVRARGPMIISGAALIPAAVFVPVFDLARFPIGVLPRILST